MPLSAPAWLAISVSLAADRPVVYRQLALYIHLMVDPARPAALCLSGCCNRGPDTKQIRRSSRAELGMPADSSQTVDVK